MVRIQSNLKNAMQLTNLTFIYNNKYVQQEYLLLKIQQTSWRKICSKLPKRPENLRSILIYIYISVNNYDILPSRANIRTNEITY